MKDILKIAIVCGLLIWLISSFAYALFAAEENVLIFDGVITSTLSFIVAAAALGAYSCHGRKSAQGRALLLIALGFIFDAFGNIAWSMPDIFARIHSLDSLAMIFFILGMIFIFVGVLSLARITGMNIMEKKRIAILAVFLTIVVYSLFTVLSDTMILKLTTTEFVMGATYVLINVAILIVAVFSLPLLQKNSIAAAWGFVVSGFFLFSLTNIIFSNAMITRVNVFPEILWNLSLLVIAAGFFTYRTAMHGMMKTEDDIRTAEKKRDILGFVAAVSVVILLIDFSTYYFFSGSPDFFIYGDVISPVIAALAVLSAFSAFKIHGKSSYQGKFILSFAVGLFFWLLADAAWGVQEILFNISETVSFADVLYYTGYAFIIGSIYFAWKAMNAVMTSKARLEYSIIMMLFFAALYYHFIGPIISNTEIAAVEKTVTIGYVVLDYILLAGCVMTLPFLHKNRIALSWTIVILGLVVSTLGDAFYVLFADAYVTGVMFDLFWHSSYVIIGLGFFAYSLAMKSIIAKGVSLGTQRRRKKTV